MAKLAFKNMSAFKEKEIKRNYRENCWNENCLDGSNKLQKNQLDRFILLDHDISEFVLCLNCKDRVMDDVQLG